MAAIAAAEAVGDAGARARPVKARGSAAGARVTGDGRELALATADSPTGALAAADGRIGALAAAGARAGAFGAAGAGSGAAGGVITGATVRCRFASTNKASS